MRDITINKSGIRTASRKKMKSNLYFSFVGNVFGKKLTNLDDVCPNKVGSCGEFLYSNTPSTDLVEIYEVKDKPGIVFVVKSGHEDGSEWFRWWLCIKESFNCLSATPPIGLKEKLQESLKK